MDATVWLTPLAGPPQPIGGQAGRGIWHEALSLVSDLWGPKTATFTLKRQPRTVFPELRARSPVMIDIGGVRVWSGRITDVPEQSGAGRQLTINCAGGQTILDDDQYERIYVFTELAGWKDQRSLLGANLANYTAGWQVSAESGALRLVLPPAATSPNDKACGVVLDAGPSSTIKRLVATVKGGGRANFNLHLRGGSTEDTAGDEFSVVATTAPTSDTTYAFTFTTARRYVRVVLANETGATATGDETSWVQISSVQAFADTAYESGNASILTADTIIKDALTRGTTGLNADRSGIGAPGFNFPDFAPSAPMTPREYIAAANAPHNWLFKIDEQLRPVFRARPTIPLVEAGPWPGTESDGDSSNSDEGIVTKVIVRGTGPDGVPISVTRTQTGTLIDRQGGAATQALDASYMLTTALANQLGDTYLAGHRVSPFKGQLAVSAGGARQVIGGTPLHPSRLLMLTGELLRRADLVDPDTGARGRTARLVQARYEHDQAATTVELDNTRQDFEALQARLGLLLPT